MQRPRALFGKKRATNILQANDRPLPSDPNFDIHAWLAESREIEEQSPEKINPFYPTAKALRLGFSDCVTLEEDADQKHCGDEMQRPDEEVKASQESPNRSAS